MENGLTITLIEVGNSDCPNIGTIHSSTGDNVEFLTKAVEAIGSHFDCDVSKIEIQDDLSFEDVKNSPPLDAVVFLEDGTSYNIEIQQTFLY